MSYTFLLETIIVFSAMGFKYRWDIFKWEQNDYLNKQNNNTLDLIQHYNLHYGAISPLALGVPHHRACVVAAWQHPDLGATVLAGLRHTVSHWFSEAPLLAYQVCATITHINQKFGRAPRKQKIRLNGCISTCRRTSIMAVTAQDKMAYLSAFYLFGFWSFLAISA